MSRSLILQDADGVKYDYDNIKTQGWLDGQPVGLDAAVAYIRKRATELFVACLSG